MRSRARERAKLHRQAERIASGERDPSPTQWALLEAVADPQVQVCFTFEDDPPHRRVSWIYRRSGSVRRQNVSVACNVMEEAGLIEQGPELRSGDRRWLLTDMGRSRLD